MGNLRKTLPSTEKSLINIVSQLILSLPLVVLSSAAISQTKFMAVGDSITAGYYDSFPSQSYRKPLTDLLTESGCNYEMVGSEDGNVLHPDPASTSFTGSSYSASVVEHEGYAGHRVDLFLNTNGFGDNPGINNTMDIFSPDIVLLQLGTNDMNWNQDPAQTVEELEEVVTRIVAKNPLATVFIANLIPWYGYSDRTTGMINVQSKVETLSGLIESSVNNPSSSDLQNNDLGTRDVVLVDVRSGFPAPADWHANPPVIPPNASTMMQLIPGGSKEGTDIYVHPNQAGDEHIADAFFDAIDTAGICDEIPTTLTIGLIDGNEYGHRFGSDQNRNSKSFTFGPSSDNLILSVDGYDIDVGTEVEVHLNDTSLGFLSTGPNNGFNATDSFTISASDIDSGENLLTFTNTTPGFIWGISNVLLASASTPLSLGQADSSEYGHRFGSDQNRESKSFVFPASSSNLILSVDGYDIDTSDEVEVLLNGVSLGFLSRGPNNSFNAGNAFAINANDINNGDNTLTFANTTPGFIWGISNVLLSPGNSLLVINQLDSNEYGHRFGSNQNRESKTFSFPASAGSLILSVDGYDIDFNDEVEVLLNGSSIGFLSKGPNNGFNSDNSFVLDVADINSGDNTLAFVNSTPGFIWGITDILLTSGVTSLTVGQLDSNEYGHRFGSDQNRESKAFSFPASSNNLTLTVTGYDIDFNDEVEVLLNGTSVGFLSKGPNNGLNAGNSFTLDASDINSDSNSLSFVNSTPGFIWGITDILLTP
jgi:hypothetical protein